MQVEQDDLYKVKQNRAGFCTASKQHKGTDLPQGGRKVAQWNMRSTWSRALKNNCGKSVPLVAAIGECADNMDVLSPVARAKTGGR